MTQYDDVDTTTFSVNSDNTAVESTASTTATLDWPDALSIESDADNLMDGLFSEVEHILDTGVVSPAKTETPHTDFVAIKPLLVPQIQLARDLLPPEPPEFHDSTVETGAKGRFLQQYVWLDRLLVGAALLSLGMTLGLWLLAPDRYGSLLARLQGQEWQSPHTQASISQIALAEHARQQEFVRYMERSLKLLDEKQHQANQNFTALAPQAGQLPIRSGPIAAHGAPLSSQSVRNPGDVIERVYIPIYQAPQSAESGLSLPQPGLPSTLLPQIQVPAVPGVAPGPGSTLNPGTVVTSNLPPTPLNPETNAGQTSRENASENLSEDSSTETISVPIPTLPPTTEPVASSPVTPSPVAPLLDHTLVGILELGQRSAALFQVNGVTRRIHLGETIGSSGWSLVEVANQEAIVRRNGEVRSVYIGQSF